MQYPRLRSGLSVALTLAVMACLPACTSLHQKPEAQPGATAEAKPKEPLPALSYPLYRVKSGDTLWAIAMHFDKDYKELARINSLDDKYTIYADQALRLEEEGKPEEPAKTVVKPPVTPPVVAAAKPATAKKPPKSAASSVAAAAAKPATGAVAKPAAAIAKTSPSVSSPVQPLPKSGSLKWGWPASGALLQRFSNEGVGSKGLDISGNRGDPVRAAAEGVVVYAGEGLVGYGKLIIVRHSEDYISAYAHNDRLIATEGQRVKLGQTIAELGSSGAERDKLHFEIRYKGKPIDPLTQLPAIN
ncbi:lipoprotein NlpD [Fluviicoccus keumensis]|uniref:Lipoprotein NlpD n=1 Tax=Fluviicoccus keumensis TaxID=1435465 RepID=A0A4Q7Z6H0_9GAMM|nr:peptidoglycan DD-metalloendopeptidase family protein [Fluviicoccus keumensis]RZU45249.1 lipoprotein NlpD [Fluviicoccus keumensis]